MTKEIVILSVNAKIYTKFSKLFTSARLQMNLLLFITREKESGGSKDSRASVSTINIHTQNRARTRLHTVHTREKPKRRVFSWR